MKVYRGYEILDVLDLMDSILFDSSLKMFVDNNPHHYRDLIGKDIEVLADMMCIMDDEENSYMFIDTNDYSYTIDVAMWVSRDDNIGFKNTMAYFRYLKNIYKGMTNKVNIKASCRTDTSLPIVEKLNGKRGVTVKVGTKTIDSLLGYGFADVHMVCEI